MRKEFQLRNFMNGVIFNSDLHVEGEILMSIANRTQPRTSYITIDIEEVESNITYSWSGTNYNNDDYILIGPERIAIRPQTAE
ncbi:hypothetical protein MSG28_009642 [Choristoneura fumiferana]|uniref:Uncharacterized protein n=1 Tax=Choristoneura fumiferana TaxID=7141 RepID=A0ACC0JCA7_CHOFU|nr:hypothetical protein MSG28_009642 [Choristoneura fumiferana]